MANEWLTHVKEVMKSSPELAFKDVLKKAKKTWKKKGDSAPSKGKTKAKAKTKSKSKSKSKTRKNRPKRYPKVVGGKKHLNE